MKDKVKRMKEKEIEKKLRECIEEMKKVNTLPEAETLAEKFVLLMESSDLKNWISKNKNSPLADDFAKEYIAFLKRLVRLV
jgi:hypothetical protein